MVHKDMCTCTTVGGLDLIDSCEVGIELPRVVKEKVVGGFHRIPGLGEQQ